MTLRRDNQDGESGGAESSSTETRMKLDCSDVAALLSGLIDDEVSGDVRHQAERHIAGCGACTALVNRAERLDSVLSDSLGIDAESPLPAGFEDAVFNRTTQAGVLHRASYKFVAYSGWLAAAAAIALTVFVYVDDRAGVADPGSRSVGANSGRPVNDRLSDAGNTQIVARERDLAHYRLGTEAFSGVYDGYRPPVGEVMGVSRDNPDPTGHTTGAMAGVDQTPADVLRHGGRFVPPFGLLADRSMAPAGRVPLIREDEDALYQLSQMLERVVNADDQSMSDIEFVRQVAEYDRLLERLDGVIARLGHRDRTFVQAAVPIINQIVHGPVTDADVREMRATIGARDLITRIDRLSGRTNPDHSM